MVNSDALRVLEFDSWATELADRARLEAGREFIRAFHPVSDVEEARVLLAETREALLLQAEGALPAMRVEKDGFDLLGHAREQGTALLAHELATIYRFLYQSCDVRMQLEMRPELEALHRLGRGIPDLMPLIREMEQTVDDRGLLLDSASPKLTTLRLEIGKLRESVRRTLEKMASRPNIRALLRSTHPTIRDDRLVLAVKTTARGQVKGIYHDQSSTGETAYIEPESVVDVQNRIVDLAADERREVTRILWGLTRSLLDARDQLISVREQLARVDFACARALIAEEFGLTEPVVELDGVWEASDVRHPILLAMAHRSQLDLDPDERREKAKEQVVPFSLRIGGSFDVMVLTGPNTGGKTVTLKAIGLLSLLPRIGCFVPALPGARVRAFADIFADIGDEQNLAQSLSTFSGHVRRMAHILNNASEGSLVLLDELGSGTDPLEGEALSAALLDHLLKKKLFAVVTTHLGRLKEIAGRRPRVANASMQFDPESLKPTYRLLTGIPGSSNALVIARNLGLPESLIQDAETLLGDSEDPARGLMEELDRSRAVVEKMKEEASEDRREAASELEKVTVEARDVESQRNNLWVEAESAAEERLKVLAREIEDPRRALGALGGDARREVDRIEEAVRKALGSSPLAERRRLFLEGLKKGDRVHLPQYNETCRIRRIMPREDRVEVDYRSMSVTVGFDEIVPPDQTHLFPPGTAT